MSNELQVKAEQNKILEIVSGSHLYGTNTPQSDEDYVGVFMPPEEYVFGLKSVQEIDVGIKSKDKDGKNNTDAVDRKLYEFRKFISLALGNNPNILELLFVNDTNIKYINPIGYKLLAKRHFFPSKLAAKKFVGYAHSQKHKMIIRRDNFNELRAGYRIMENIEDKLTMGQLFDRYQAELDEAYKNPLAILPEENIFFKKETGMHIHCGDICFEPGVYVKKARRMLKERLDKATNRSELVLKYGYDTKFASHLIRLLHEGLDLLNNGELIFPLPRAYEILDIKNGKWDIKDVIKYADELEAKLDDTLKTTKLPATPYYKEIENFTIETMKQHLL